MTRRRRNTTTRTMKNLKMDDAVFALRKAAMNHIRDAKRMCAEIGIELPRIELRITGACTSDVERGDGTVVLGRGRMGDNVVWIAQKTVTNRTDQDLRQVVLHEICHAAWAIDHDESCPLMAAMHVKMTPSGLNRAFLKHAKARG
jgi:hypothetical protein